MRKTICASVLVCALCVTTLAGDILNPPAPVNFEDSSDTTLSSGEQTADGITHGDNEDGVAAAALSLLNSVLALL